MISTIFAKELTRIFIALVFFLLLGRITGNWLASFGFVLFVYIIWIYSKLYQINQWIEGGLLDSKRPASDGAWERLIFLIHQKDKKSKNRKAKTNTLLKHFQGVVRGLPFATVVLNDMNEIEWANTMSAELLQIKPSQKRIEAKELITLYEIQNSTQCCLTRLRMKLKLPRRLARK